MKNYLKKIIILFCLIVFLVLPYFVSAELPSQKLKEVGGGSYITDTVSVGSLVATVIQAALGLLGLIFLVLIIYAGYNWMIARGEEEKVTKAKDTLTRAVIGLIIVVGAYAISYFVIDNLIYKGGILQ
ncbi:MAG: hypothetical protein WC349_02595 [Patescibacteria group bacterium]|jgi:hypothetical protein